MKSATLRQLRVFASVAKHLNFGRAAEQLHLTSLAVSMQIRELETQVGLPLFDWSGRKVALMVTGEYLLVCARKILVTLKDAEDAIACFRWRQRYLLLRTRTRRDVSRERVRRAAADERDVLTQARSARRIRHDTGRRPR